MTPNRQRREPAAQRHEAMIRTVVVVCNFTPVPRLNYRVGVPRGGLVDGTLLNSDAKDYGGSGMGNMGEVEAAPVPATAGTFRCC